MLAPYQLRALKLCKPSLSVISAGFMALGKSCLLANTSREASRSSSCACEDEAWREGQMSALLQDRGVEQQCFSQLLHTAAVAAAAHPRLAFPRMAGIAVRIYLVEHAHQLVPGLSNTVSIIAVHHEDEALGVLEVVSPQGTNLWRHGEGRGVSG
eukprot:1158707-Pelagomonas_calceolata.AAC.3